MLFVSMLMRFFEHGMVKQSANQKAAFETLMRGLQFYE